MDLASRIESEVSAQRIAKAVCGSTLPLLEIVDVDLADLPWALAIGPDCPFVRVMFGVVFHGITMLVMALPADSPTDADFTLRTKEYGFQVLPADFKNCFTCPIPELDNPEFMQQFMTQREVLRMAQLPAEVLHGWFDKCCKSNGYKNPYEGYLT